MESIKSWFNSVSENFQKSRRTSTAPKVLPTSDKDLFWLIHQTCYANDDVTLLDILERSQCNPEVLNTLFGRSRHTLLHITASLGSIDVTKVLLKYGMAPDVKDSLEHTPLTLAARNDRREIFKLLLDYGADPNSKNKEGFTIVHWLSSNGRVDSLKYILNQKANINVFDKQRQTPLHISCQNGHIDCVVLLLENGADLNLKDDAGFTPIKRASRYGQTAVMELLMKKKAVIEDDEDSEESITKLILRGGFTACALLLINHKQSMINNFVRDGMKLYEDEKHIKSYKALQGICQSSNQNEKLVLEYMAKDIYDTAVLLLRESHQGSVEKVVGMVTAIDDEVGQKFINKMKLLTKLRTCPSWESKNLNLIWEKLDAALTQCAQDLHSVHYSLETAPLAGVDSLKYENNCVMDSSIDNHKCAPISPISLNKNKTRETRKVSFSSSAKTDLSTDNDNITDSKADETDTSKTETEKFMLKQHNDKSGKIFDSETKNKSSPIKSGRKSGKNPPILSSNVTKNKTNSQETNGGYNEKIDDVESQSFVLSILLNAYYLYYNSSIDDLDNGSSNSLVDDNNNSNGANNDNNDDEDDDNENDDSNNSNDNDDYGDISNSSNHDVNFLTETSTIEEEPAIPSSSGEYPHTHKELYSHKFSRRRFRSETLTSEQLSFSAFIKKHLKVLRFFVRQNPKLLFSYFHFILDVPKMLDHFRLVIEKESFVDRKKWFYENLKPDGSGASIYAAEDNPMIEIHRENVFTESCQAFLKKAQDTTGSSTIIAPPIRFSGEDGVGDGVRREWFDIISKELFNANYGLFELSAEKDTFQPNPSSYVNPDHLQYFRFCGQIIGMAIYEERTLECYFTRSFYKHILDKKVDYTDVESIDPEYYKSLRWVLDNDITDCDLGLTFSIETNVFGQLKNLPLKANGFNIPVTESNKFEFVRLATEQKMTIAIGSQIEAFLDGFYKYIPKTLIGIFNEYELELLISGLPNIDVNDWKNHTYISDDILLEQNIVQWFFEVLKEATEVERAMVLQFSTGSSRVPIGGFDSLKRYISAEDANAFTLSKLLGGDERLPTASTCFNMLKLPLYSSKEILKKQLFRAVYGVQGFDFV